MSALDLEALRGLVEAALRPFAGDYMLSDISPKTRVDVGGKVPRKSEWFEVEGLTVGDFHRARAAYLALHPSDGEGHGSVGPSRNQGEG